jgi:hypothetical protein
MKLFKVDGGVLRVSPGTVLRLTAAQISARLHALKGLPEKLPGGPTRVECQTTLAAEFKSGEIVGIAEADVAKPFRAMVIDLDRNGQPLSEAAKAKAGAGAKP